MRAGRGLRQQAPFSVRRGGVLSAAQSAGEALAPHQARRGLQEEVRAAGRGCTRAWCAAAAAEHRCSAALTSDRPRPLRPWGPSSPVLRDHVLGAPCRPPQHPGPPRPLSPSARLGQQLNTTDAGLHGPGGRWCLVRARFHPQMAAAPGLHTAGGAGRSEGRPGDGGGPG